MSMSIVSAVPPFVHPRLVKANDGGLIQNLVRMTTTRLLRDDFEIMLPINQVWFPPPSPRHVPRQNYLSCHSLPEFAEIGGHIHVSLA